MPGSSSAAERVEAASAGEARARVREREEGTQLREELVEAWCVMVLMAAEIEVDREKQR